MGNRILSKLQEACLASHFPPLAHTYPVIPHCTIVSFLTHFSSTFTKVKFLFFSLEFFEEYTHISKISKWEEKGKTRSSWMMTNDFLFFFKKKFLMNCQESFSSFFYGDGGAGCR